MEWMIGSSRAILKNGNNKLLANLGSQNSSSGARSNTHLISSGKLEMFFQVTLTVILCNVTFPKSSLLGILIPTVNGICTTILKFRLLPNTL